MATNEKITLNVDLYDNIMTEQKGDYTGEIGYIFVCSESLIN